MKHTLLYFFTIEKDTRVLVKGHLLDENNNPLAGAEINVFTSRDYFLSSGNYLLGTNYTKTDGTFKVVSLFDEHETFSVEISKGEDYSNYTYITNTKDYLPENLEFDLKTVYLKRLANFQFNITKTSNQPDVVLQFSFTVKSTNCYEFYERGVLLPSPQYSCYDDFLIGTSLNTANPNVSSAYKTLLGTTVVFKYSKNNEPEITQTFIIDQENYEFNFTY